MKKIPSASIRYWYIPYRKKIEREKSFYPIILYKVVKALSYQRFLFDKQ